MRIPSRRPASHARDHEQCVGQDADEQHEGERRADEDRQRDEHRGEQERRAEGEQTVAPQALLDLGDVARRDLGSVVRPAATGAGPRLADACRALDAAVAGERERRSHAPDSTPVLSGLRQAGRAL